MTARAVADAKALKQRCMEGRLELYEKLMVEIKTAIQRSSEDHVLSNVYLFGRARDQAGKPRPLDDRQPITNRSSREYTD